VIAPVLAVGGSHSCFPAPQPGPERQLLAVASELLLPAEQAGIAARQVAVSAGGPVVGAPQGAVQFEDARLECAQVQPARSGYAVVEGWSPRAVHPPRQRLGVVSP